MTTKQSIIKADYSRQHADALMVLGFGVLSDPTTKRFYDGIVERGLECSFCKQDLTVDVKDAEFRDAAGIGLCVNCYIEAGLENAHNDGLHEDTLNERCPQCKTIIADESDEQRLSREHAAGQHVGVTPAWQGCPECSAELAAEEADDEPRIQHMSEVPTVNVGDVVFIPGYGHFKVEAAAGHRPALDPAI